MIKPNPPVPNRTRHQPRLAEIREPWIQRRNRGAAGLTSAQLSS